MPIRPLISEARCSCTPATEMSGQLNPEFQKLVKEMGLGQSMSRRGNCWDNAPQESFFGHFKVETNLKECETLDEVKREVKSYMKHY